MILHRLRLKRFQGISDGGFEFAPGINVIVGGNEAGKSTLRRALRMALYANPATTSQKIAELRTWGTEEAPEIHLEFEIEGKRFALTKDFASRRVLLAGSGRTWESQKTVQESLINALGLQTEQLFEATAQVAQAELERVQLTSIARELSRIVGGGGEDVSTAIKRLEQRIREMEKGSRGLAKDPGILRSLEDRATALRLQHDRLVAGSSEADRTARELAEVQRQLEDTRQRLETKRALLDTNRRILQREQELEIRRSQAAMLAERVTKIEEAHAALGELKSKLEAVTASGMPDEQVVQAARATAERIRVRELESVQLARSVQEPLAATVPHLAAWRAMVLAGVLAGLAGLFLAVTGTSLGWSLLGGGVVAGGIGLWKMRGATAAQQAQHTLRADRGARLLALEGDLASDRSQFDGYLATLGVGRLETAADKLRTYTQIVQETARVESVLAAMRERASDDNIRDQWNTVRLDVFGIEQELRHPDTVGRRLTALEFQSLEAEVSRLDQDRSRLERQEHRLTWELERLRQEAETLADVEEQLQEVGDALAAARKQHAVYTVALDGLRDARKQAEVPVREVVAGTASEFLRILSGGRYRELVVDKDSLEVTVWSDDASAWVAPTEPSLSRGTVDLVYLSLRLALVGALAEGKHPPLLLDDPFITFDDRRREAAARLLRELSKTHQVFLFTYTRHYDDVADRVIELPARGQPSREDPLEREDRVPSFGPLWENPRTS